MPYITARKRALGHGAAGAGTEHHWRMTVSSVALLILTPLFLLTFGRGLGMEFAEARAFYAGPFPAIVGILTLLAGFWHFADGVRTLIEDYSRGLTRKALIVATKLLSATAGIAGIFAIVRLAL
ncbi:MAG: succinate dehydrogenase, hydrophobic membrane anchor protein [Paracoccaceae bacterium]